MESTINLHMGVKELENILSMQHGINLPYGWHIALWMLFSTYEATEARVIGFGSSAQFVFADGSVACTSKPSTEAEAAVKPPREGRY